MNKTQSGAIGELIVAKELVANGYRIHFPYQGNNKEDDLTVVNEKTGNVRRVQVKTKQDDKKWSAIFFKDIKANDALFYILYEQPTESYYIVPSKVLIASEADKKGFADAEGKYLNKWDLMK